jgi:hypothetical protein
MGSGTYVTRWFCDGRVASSRTHCANVVYGLLRKEWPHGGTDTNQ